MTKELFSNDGATYSFSWTVELHEFNLNVSNLFHFRLNYGAPNVSSVYFEIANDRSGSSSATAAASSAITTSTTQSPIVTSSSSPSPAANGRSIGTLGIALGLGIPVVLANILIALFVFLKRKKTIPDPNRTQYISSQQISSQQIEVPGDFFSRNELSRDRFFELPATGCS